MHNRLWLKGGVIALGCLYCSFFIIAGCIVLLKETADMKECPCDDAWYATMLLSGLYFLK